MEGLPNQNQPPENNAEDAVNFAEISEKRRELRRAINELGAGTDDKKATSETPDGLIFEKHYKKPLEEVQRQASGFKVADFGGLEGAKKVLVGQKKEHEKSILEDRAQIDYEAILKETPKVGEVQRLVENIAGLKDFRMRRMLETLNPQTSMAARKRNEGVLKTIKKEVEEGESELERSEPLVLRQAELIEYKENLAQSGHICITPSVEENLEAIGDRMLTSRPMFLHGPTGTGKTSLARFAAAHFTGKDPEMIFCNPQTKESNVWGKTAIRAARGKAGVAGAIETVEIYGPLSRAMAEGKVVIFDEFTALPKEQMVFIKGVFNAKAGDRINIVGNGIVEIKPGFQMIFTANLKSEKNPERQDLPPEIAREFEQNNLEIKYTPQGEAYDVMLARLLNRDGSLNMSFYDLNTTLPNLCKVMAEIQESYTDETDKEVARRAGALDAGGKVHSLKKFVMTQGSIEAILSSWLVERQVGRQERTFAEFLDQRFKTALTFKEYSKDDRILVAKILASRGFLLTLEASDLDLPEDIFQLNAIKSMRGDDAVDELKKKSGDTKRLSLKEIAELDPFGKRADKIKRQAEALLEDESNTKDPFLKSARGRFNKVFGKESQNQSPEISAIYTYTDPKTHKAERPETITLNIEDKLQDFLSFYQKTGIDLPADFDETIRDIWERNSDQIQQAVEQNGFDDLLVVPDNVPLPVLAEKMKMGGGYYLGSNFKEGGDFAGATRCIDKPRIILVHKTQELTDRPELSQTINILGQDVNRDQVLTLEDYLVFQRKYFEETGKHLDEVKYTWLATHSGARLVGSGWDQGGGKLDVRACDPDYRGGNLGARPSAVSFDKKVACILGAFDFFSLFSFNFCLRFRWFRLVQPQGVLIGLPRTRK